MSHLKPQTAEVLMLLRLYASTGITPHDAIRGISCYRLAARIHELREAGFLVRSRREYVGGKPHERYWIIEQPVQLTAGLVA